jgi:hypothetical protein
VPVALWIAAAIGWTPNPVVGFGLLLAGVVVLWRRKIPTYVALVAVPVAYLAGWCALGQVLALTDATFLSSRLGWAIGWVIVTAAVLYAGGTPLSWLAARRDVRPASVDRVRGAVRWTWLPAGLFAAVGAVQSTSFDLAARWVTPGTDPMQLILLMQQMAREGALVTTRNLGETGNLAGQAYPKGLHWMMTAALGPAVDPSSLSSSAALELYIRVFGGFVWLTIAAMFCVAAALFLHAVRRRQHRPAVAVVAACVLLAGVVGVQQFGAIVVFQGALASGAAVACVWALFWVAVAGPRLRVLATVIGGALFVTANAWQPIVVVIVTMAVFLLWGYRSRIVHHMQATRVRAGWAWSTAAALGVIAVVIIAVPVTGLALAGGADHANATGRFVAPSLPLAGLEVVLLLFVAVRYRLFRRLGRSGIARAVVGAILGSELVWLAMTVATRGDVGAYYPLKVAWFTVVFGWPLLAYAIGLAVVWCFRAPANGPRATPGRRGPGLRRVGAAVIGCVALGLGASAWRSPPPTLAAALGTQDRPILLSLVTLPDPPAGSRYVPYLVNRPPEPQWKASYVWAKLLAFRFDTPYLVWTTDEPTCAILRSRQPVILLTTRSPAEVAQSLQYEDGCRLTSWRVVHVGE